MSILGSVETRNLIPYIVSIVLGVAIAVAAFMVVSSVGADPKKSSDQAAAKPSPIAALPADSPAPAEPVAQGEDALAEPDDVEGVGGGLAPVDDSARRGAALERALAGTGAGASASTGSGSGSSRLERQRYLERQAARKGLASGQTMRSPKESQYQGTGSFTTVSSNLPVRGVGGRTVRYAVQIEGGLSADIAGFAAHVDRVLGDPRGWTGTGKVRVQQVSSADSADFTVRLSSPSMTDSLCAPMTTESIYSCRNGRNVVINYYRWIAGAGAYPASLAAYRVYLVNHEFGHALGQDHRSCPGSGSTAPVMLQQSIGLQGCVASEWPTPAEASTVR